MGVGDGRGSNDKYTAYNLRKAAEDKTRMVDTTQGQVPLRRGKYGMDVEEYLEWKAATQFKYRFEKLTEQAVDWEAIDAES